MATKKDLSRSCTKQSYGVPNENPYNNLVMHQNQKPFETVNLKSSADNYDKGCFDVKAYHSLGKSEGKRDWCNKSDKSHHPTEFSESRNITSKVSSKLGSNHSANNSTLSLHIAAYENSIDVPLADNSMAMKISCDMKNVKQVFNGSNIFDPFEIPRQQKEDNNEPEIMHFKASQKLLNPNESNSLDDLQSSSDKSTSDLKDSSNDVKEQLDGSSLQNSVGVPEEQNALGRIMQPQSMQETPSQGLSDILAAMCLDSDEKRTMGNGISSDENVPTFISELQSVQETPSQALSGLFAKLNFNDDAAKRTIENKIPEERESLAIEPKPIPKTSSQKLIDEMSKMILHDAIDALTMEKNAHLYKDGFFHLMLNEVHRNDSEDLSILYAQFCVAFSHVLFWKYSHHKFPPDSFISKVWYDDAKSMPQMFWYCIDTFIANYIDQHLESLKRWIYRQQLEEMEVMFLNKEQKKVISHCIHFAEPDGSGVVATKIPHMKNLVKTLKNHLGKVLTHFQLAPALDVDVNELHEFKILCQFRRSIANKTRSGEHDWKEAPDYMPLSKHFHAGGVSNNMKDFVFTWSDDDNEGEDDAEKDEGHTEIKKREIKIPQKVMKAEVFDAPNEEIETTEKATKVEGAETPAEIEESEEKEEVCGLHIEYRRYLPEEQNLLKPSQK